ncbi:pyridoxamine 5'-phosphate oxidase [Micromonospora zingiberis]|uniref:Pyridoxamine 5'-phosphate oxidase n=1 Tax=Micromonospora zingiberis TaxID=2053011 RepID=A0A4R0GUF6_9ACTN|nr:pyridoxamine 5'-phosphate oxidase family protein [Micromonospora zingiberis]TCC00314.1 pyridoxamine 5'-phosphate oxidase [Micromonospora zingiberis]
MDSGTDATLPQGDPRLLDHPVARQLLASTELARVAYVAPDGTPRVLPMMFHATDDEVVFCTFGGARKIAHLRARPQVAVTIDAAGPPPLVLLLRGPVTVTDVDGIAPEYLAAHHRYGGEQAVAAIRAELDGPGLVMARIALRPTWVGVLDFVTRFPRGITTAEDFARIGRD